MKALVLALKGPAQRWYTNLPDGHIHSWSQLQSELSTSFRSIKPDELTSCDFHDIKQGDKETLQEYLQRVVKLRAKAPEVPAQSIIDAAIRGLTLGPCGEYLERCMPKIGMSFSRSCKNTASRIEAEGEGSRK